MVLDARDDRVGDRAKAHVWVPAIAERVQRRCGQAVARPWRTRAQARDGIPFTSFAVDDVRAEWVRLRALGVLFTQEPTELGPVTTAVLDDTCGNLNQIAHYG